MGAEMGFTMKRKIKWKVVVAAGAAVIAVGVIANVVFRYFRYDAYKPVSYTHLTLPTNSLV